MQQIYSKILYDRESVIIFDEVQACPKARQAIKYPVQDGRYDYIETGSLISIKKNTEGITIPSEEERIQMCPMDYEEFRWALGDTATFPLLRLFWDKDFTENVIYDKLLTDKLPVNLGYVYENLVAQMLVASGNKLFYHTWPKDEKHYYEVDFLLSRGAKLLPIEVKSSGYKSHASLDNFCMKYSSRIMNRCLIYTKDVAREEEILYVPVYMTPLL